jgi:hydroxymethylglutaryl-CoA reductase (NADPH)
LASSSQANIQTVDITTPGLRSLLNTLVEASATDLRHQDGQNDSHPRDLLVKVSPPIHIKVVLPPSTLSSATRSFSYQHNHQRSSSYTGSTTEFIESLMSTWTRLVGDPILSKWIVVMLAISITFNGYLLKGIAAGVVGARFAETLGVGATKPWCCSVDN